MRLGVHTTSKGRGGFTSSTTGADAITAVENSRRRAEILDGVVTWWRSAALTPSIAGSGCGEDEWGDEPGDKKMDEQHHGERSCRLRVFVFRMCFEGGTGSKID